MASNLTIQYPLTTGIPLPQAELVPFGNNSASTQDSAANYVAGTPAVTTPVTSRPRYHEQYTKGQFEYPR